MRRVRGKAAEKIGARPDAAGRGGADHRVRQHPHPLFADDAGMTRRSGVRLPGGGHPDPSAGISLRLGWSGLSLRGAASAALLELLVALPAVPSGIALMRGGMGMHRAWIDHTLLPDYTIPGILLLVVIGGGAAAAATATLVRPQLARPAALASGVVLLAWLAIETLMIGWHGGPQLVLDLAYGAIGCVLAAVGLRGMGVAVAGG